MPDTTPGYEYVVALGGDAEEPTIDVGLGETELDRDAKPNHAGILAQSIDAAHPRVRTASASATSGILPFGSLAQAVAAYGRATHSAIAHGILTVVEDGQYHCHLRFERTGSAGGIRVEIGTGEPDGAQAIVDTLLLDAGVYVKAAVVEVDLSAGEGFTVDAATVGGDTLAIAYASIRRTGP